MGEPTPGLREAHEARVADATARVLDALTNEGWVADDEAVAYNLRVAEHIARAALAASPAPEPTGLDAAWAEAEAALPHKGVTIGIHSWARSATERTYQAVALTNGSPGGTGPTPEAALRALAARLTGEGS